MCYVFHSTNVARAQLGESWFFLSALVISGVTDVTARAPSHPVLFIMCCRILRLLGLIRALTC